MRQAVALGTRPQTLLVVVVVRAARHILGAVQMPYENLLAVGLFEGIPAGAHCVEVVLIERYTNQRAVYFLNDCVSVLEAVDGHGRLAAELKAQADAVRLALLNHFLENSNCILADLLAGRGQAALLHVLARYDNDHLAAEDVAAADDLVQLSHHGVLFLLRLLHVEEAQRIVGKHLEVVALEPCAHLLEGDLAGLEVAVQALRLNVNAVEAVFLAQLEIHHNTVVLAETVICFIKSEFHGNCSPFLFSIRLLVRLYYTHAAMPMGENRM